jgi:hypothetical protein
MAWCFDQPPSSAEYDPAKRAAAERDAYRRFFDLKRKQTMLRQKRVGEYAWLLIVPFIVLHLAVCVYREQDHSRDPDCGASDHGDGRRQGYGPFGHAQGGIFWFGFCRDVQGRAPVLSIARAGNNRSASRQRRSRERNEGHAKRPCDSKGFWRSRNGRLHNDRSCSIRSSRSFAALR